MAYNFYNFMMFFDGSVSNAKHAWTIHRFLMSCSSLLSKCFLFFKQNVKNYHWISSCMCNPWFSVLQYKNNLPGVEIPSNLEMMDADEFIHGWLMFDPMKGFVKDANMTEELKRFRDIYVWLLNMSALYQDV